MLLSFHAAKFDAHRNQFDPFFPFKSFYLLKYFFIFGLLQCPDYFVVGYGMDYAEVYRNLPYIGVLKPEYYQ